jgi:hypothetical protein
MPVGDGRTTSSLYGSVTPASPRVSFDNALDAMRRIDSAVDPELEEHEPEGQQSPAQQTAGLHTADNIAALTEEEIIARIAAIEAHLKCVDLSDGRASTSASDLTSRPSTGFSTSSLDSGWVMERKYAIAILVGHKSVCRGAGSHYR